jgi:hypothetical protein
VGKRTAIPVAIVLALFVVAPSSASAFRLFQSPSHNIGCAISKKFGVRCDIAEHDWPTPPKPASCELDYGGGLEVGRRGKGHFVCAGDTLLNQGAPLPYGNVIRRGRFKCKSRVISMRCTNIRNGHGFSLAREFARRF